MENPFLFAAKGLGIAPTFFPKNYQQEFGQKRQRRSFSLRGIFSQEKGGENAFLFFVFLQQLQHGVHGFVFAFALGSEHDRLVYGQHLT